MTYNFKNLVFEGGVVKGIAYLGAMEVFDSKNILAAVERVGGTSAGAIYAVVTGLNYSIEEIQEIIWNMDFNKFMDDSWGVIRNSSRLLNQFGWFKGDYFLNWMKELIKKKTGSATTTFRQLETMKKINGFKSIYLIGCNLSTGFSEIYSAETTPDMPICDAVRISMSIPVFFASVRTANGDTLVDGGTVNNYPVKLFDRKKYVTGSHYKETDYYQPLNTQNGQYQVDYVFNEETLGFKLDSKEKIDVFWYKQEPTHSKINDLFDYTKQLVSTVIDMQSDVHLHSDDWARSIYIDSLNVSATDFSLSDETKTKLINSGKEGTLRYFEWYDNQ